MYYCIKHPHELEDDGSQKIMTTLLSHTAGEKHPAIRNRSNVDWTLRLNREIICLLIIHNGPGHVGSEYCGHQNSTATTVHHHRIR